MTELQLYNFIKGNNVEWHNWTGSNDVYICLNFNKVKEFYSLLSKCIFDDGGLECLMKDGYFCFEMDYICSYHGIELRNVFY